MNTAKNSSTGARVRQSGGYVTATYLGRPRAFWMEKLAPAAQPVPGPIFDITDFDVAAIVDELHYGSDCAWAA